MGSNKSLDWGVQHSSLGVSKFYTIWFTFFYAFRFTHWATK
jgi:hypothetical protein